jgi:hypothetical protein
MTVLNVPLLPDQRYIFELPNGHFVRIDLNANANEEFVVEHLDHTGEFVAGLQIPAGCEACTCDPTCGSGCEVCCEDEANMLTPDQLTL